MRGPGSGGRTRCKRTRDTARVANARGAQQLQGVIGSSAPARSPPRRWVFWKRRRARSPTARGSTMARDGQDPLAGCSRAPCPPPSSLVASSPLPPRDPRPATRSPWALRWNEVLRQPRGRGVRTSPSAPNTFSPFPSLPRCWQTPRRLSIPHLHPPPHTPAANQSPAPGSARPAPASHWAPRARGWG